MKELVRYIRNPATKKPHRGSLSRVAEYLGVTPMTVSRWYSGQWSPGRETADKIREMIAENYPISSRHKGHSGRKQKPK